MEPSQGRRLHAAMELAGIASTDALAQRISQPGMSKGTLDRIARDLRQIKEHEAAWIAQATNLPAGFFLDAVPVAELAAGAESTLAAVLAAIQAQLTAQTEVLNELRDVLLDVKALLGKDTETAERIEAASVQTDESVRRLEEGVKAAGLALRASTPGPAEAAAEPARKRSPRASKPSPA